MAKSQFTKIKKDTKKWHILQLLLREQGVTVNEIVSAGLVSNKNTVGSIIEQLIDMSGYDVRNFPRRMGNVGAPTKIYKIVGQWSWNGDYTDFTQSSQNVL